MLIKDNLGIIILNPESNPIALKKTVRTVNEHFRKAQFLSVINDQAKDLKENEKHAKIIIGGNTITSLIDAGIRNTDREWIFITIAGTFLKHYTLRKFEFFLNNEKEILYPVVDRRYAFDEATINGILMNRKTIEDVGYFGSNNKNIRIAKLYWANNAIDKGYNFKPIVGCRLV